MIASILFHERVTPENGFLLIYASPTRQTRMWDDGHRDNRNVGIMDFTYAITKPEK
jgi:hypothetical protein